MRSENVHLWDKDDNIFILSTKNYSTMNLSERINEIGCETRKQYRNGVSDIEWK